jgi:hypothetical protein
MEEYARALSAQLLAIEVLLDDPESLGDDVLESCLYILQEKLKAATGSADMSLLEGTGPAA